MNFPAYERGQWIAAATTASPAVPLAGTPVRVAAAADIMVWNPGPNDVQIVVGDSTVVADSSCLPVPAGALWAFRKGEATCLAAIARGGAQTILVILGEGN